MATEITEVTEDDTTETWVTSTAESVVVPKALAVAVLCALCDLCGKRLSVRRSKHRPQADFLARSVFPQRRMADSPIQIPPIKIGGAESRRLLSPLTRPSSIKSRVSKGRGQ